jgi:GNAT superfamily N-acetyltransferase
MELYAEYMQEREGATVISAPDGFLSYRIDGEECLIVSMFVRKASRTSDVSVRLLDTVLAQAKERRCRYMSGNVHLGTKNASESMKFFLALGARPLSANNSVITFVKEL